MSNGEKTKSSSRTPHPAALAPVIKENPLVARQKPQTTEATPQPDLTDDVVCPTCQANSTLFSFYGGYKGAQIECESCRLLKESGGAHDPCNQTEDRNEQWGEDDLSYYCRTDPWGSTKSQTQSQPLEGYGKL